jgi:hypothetical protein
VVHVTSNNAVSNLECFVCSMFRAIIRCIKFLKRSANALECMYVILLRSDHRHVSATQVAVFRVVRTRIQLPL